MIFSRIFLPFYPNPRRIFGSYSLILILISTPGGSAPAIPRAHRISPCFAKEVDATLNQYVAMGLAQHSTSPYSSPLASIPKKNGTVFSAMPILRRLTKSAAPAIRPPLTLARFLTP